MDIYKEENARGWELLIMDCTGWQSLVLDSGWWQLRTVVL